ncbi:ABC transporter ATP-binding protein [Moritella sp. 24]|uniref:ABC transporter ATP-binding protein n=1 Tax=Moritella sp. 24 TaxID=2746230 RepID=UPI001BA655BB|nr:ABC transporter ATP-binding protein [Moritella sp. 24]QUM76222.1 ABC transporter ATP-binding protein [Moritella sp. 24]
MSNLASKAIQVENDPISHTQAMNISISNGRLRYSDSTAPVLQGLNITMLAGQWTCILGRSGCGKTTLLRHLAGLLNQKTEWSGDISVYSALTIDSDLKSKSKPSPQLDLTQHIAYMAQQDLLLPWLSVLENVKLSSKFGDEASAGDTKKALDLLSKVGLADNADSLPQQLSGGMRQRVALARTLMQDKPVVLMDEPFSALDAVTRYRLQDLACELLKDKTVVLITHEPQEAIRLAHQIYIMQGAPASTAQLQVPTSATPRPFDAECAQLQQRIMTCLAQEYEADHE